MAGPWTRGRLRGKPLPLAGVLRWLGCLSVLLAAAPAIGAVEVPPAVKPAGDRLAPSDLNAWMDGFLPEAMTDAGIAGAAIVIVKDGAVLVQRGFGMADVAARKPVDPAATMFRIGSVSKLFTWTATMQMVEQGKLDLDRDVNAYLDFEIPPFGGRPLTLRTLMTHTAGFEETGRRFITTARAVPELGTLLRSRIPARIFAPGEVPAYSNYGAALAGYLVQRVSGQRFEDYMALHVFAPLGMYRASFGQPLPDHLRSYMSEGYAVAGGPPQSYEMLALAPAGSMAATVADMAAFMLAHLNHGRPLLVPMTANLMHAPVPTELRRIDRMTLGFLSGERNGHRMLAHGGSTRVFHSGLWLFPDDGLGVFLVLNSAGRDGAAGGLLADAIARFVDRYLPARGPQDRDAVSGAWPDAGMMDGYYQSSRRGHSSFLGMAAFLNQLRVLSLPDGSLRVGRGRALRNANDWVPVAPWLWREPDGDGKLEARVVEGRVERFATGPVSIYQPVPWYLSVGWMLPVMQAAFLGVLSWLLGFPLESILRRCGSAPAAPQRLPRRWWLQAAAALSVLATAGWAYAFAIGLPAYRLYDGGLDWLLALLQWVTPAAFVAFAAAATCHAAMAWRGCAGWPTRLAAILLVMAAAVGLWALVAFRLYGLGLDF